MPCHIGKPNLGRTRHSLIGIRSDQTWVWVVIFVLKFRNVLISDEIEVSETQTLADFFKKLWIVICRVRYERLPGRVWVCHSGQFMPDTLLTDLSINILDSIIWQDILRCWNLESHTEKRHETRKEQRKEGYVLFIAGNSSVTPYVCIVYVVCPLCTSLSLVSEMFRLFDHLVQDG